jgi:hypothetical protein
MQCNASMIRIIIRISLTKVCFELILIEAKMRMEMKEKEMNDMIFIII